MADELSSAELHTARLKSMLIEAMQHARENETRVSDPKARALLVKTAAALEGLIAGYDQTEQRAEPVYPSSGDE